MPDGDVQEMLEIESMDEALLTAEAEVLHGQLQATRLVAKRLECRLERVRHCLVARGGEMRCSEARWQGAGQSEASLSDDESPTAVRVPRVRGWLQREFDAGLREAPVPQCLR
jgi:hypothetical protein